MTFPTHQSSATSVEDTAVTSHTVNLPASIASGDLLIGVFGTWTDTAHTWPNEGTDWIVLFESTGQQMRASLAWRKADGTEGASITVTSAAADESAACVVRITGHEDPATQPPEYAEYNFAGSSEDFADPPSLSPTGGAKDYLWLAFCTNRFETYDAFPTNYTNTAQARASDSSGDMNAGVGSRQLNAATEDPNGLGFDWGANRYFHTFTVAVHPASAVQASNPPRLWPMRHWKGF